MSVVNGFQKKISNLGPCIHHWREWVKHEWALGHCMVGFENSFNIRKWPPDLSITFLKFKLELSNEHWPNLWYRCECTSFLIIVCHNWIWWLTFSSSLFQVIYRTWSYTFMIMSYTPLAINWALRIELPFAWKYISLTLKQQGHMAQHKSTCLCKHAKIL